MVPQHLITSFIVPLLVTSTILISIVPHQALSAVFLFAFCSFPPKNQDFV